MPIAHNGQNWRAAMARTGARWPRQIGGDGASGGR